MPANRPAAPSLRADVEAMVRILREESDPYPDEDATAIGRRGGFAYCADELAQVLASHPEQDQAARTLTALRSALTDAMVRWSCRDVLDECSGDLARILDQHPEPAAIAAEAASPDAGAADALLRDVLESLCRRDGLSLESSVVPGEPARNYELASRLGIGHVFGLQEPAPAVQAASTAGGDEIVPWSEIQPGNLVLLDGRMVTAGRTGTYENAAAPGSIITMMRIVYAKETGGVVIREVNPGHLTARRRPAPPVPELTAEELHARFACPGWEYRMTTGPRKVWADASKPPEGDGWEPNTAVCPDAWERFDYHEEAYWRRPVPDSTTTAAGTGEK